MRIRNVAIPTRAIRKTNQGLTMVTSKILLEHLCSLKSFCYCLITLHAVQNENIKDTGEGELEIKGLCHEINIF
jgi:hypothetical protein